MRDGPRGASRVSLRHDGFDRAYLLHVPSGPGPFALVMMLHGAGGSADFAAVETGWSDHAAIHGFAVVYPEALAVKPDKKSKFLTNPQEWNDGSGRGRHDDVGFLTSVLDDLADQFDPNRIYVTGFSNGAGMTFRFASERADRITAIAPVSGHCWIDPKPARPVATLYLVGDSDPLVPMSGGPVRSFWGTRETRPPVEDTLRKWGNAIGQAARVEVRVIGDHGHHWPGGRALLGQRLGGPVSSEVEATQEIWEFFERWPGTRA